MLRPNWAVGPIQEYLDKQLRWKRWWARWDPRQRFRRLMFFLSVSGRANKGLDSQSRTMLRTGQTAPSSATRGSASASTKLDGKRRPVSRSVLVDEREETAILVGRPVPLALHAILDVALDLFRLLGFDCAVKVDLRLLLGLGQLNCCQSRCMNQRGDLGGFLFGRQQQPRA